MGDKVIDKVEGLLRGGVILEPEDVWIAGVKRGAVQVLDQSLVSDGRHGAAIKPTMDFRMTVGKGKSCGATVIISRPVHHKILSVRVGVADHAEGKPAVVDAVLVFVDEDEKL